MPGRPPRRPIEPILEALIEGKPQKQIGAEIGIARASVNNHLVRFVRESGCRTLIQALVRYDRKRRG